MKTLHLVRGAEAANEAPPVADGDWIVYLPTMRFGARTLTHDELVALLFAADRVITW
ncbi:MAG TPA: hypothetical protein VGM88_30035 [Kofleriaceae bacterium]